MSMVLPGRSILLTLVAVMLLVPFAASAHATPSQSSLRATHNGKPIPLKEVGNHHCTDIAYPVLTCFDTNAQVEKFMASKRASVSRTNADEPVSTADCVEYAVFYEHSSYGGKALYACVNYSNLHTIGWGDRISSSYHIRLGYCVYNDTNYVSNGYCPGTNISNYGNIGRNDKVSSISFSPQ